MTIRLDLDLSKRFKGFVTDGLEYKPKKYIFLISLNTFFCKTDIYFFLNNKLYFYVHLCIFVYSGKTMKTEYVLNFRLRLSINLFYHTL